MNGMSALTMLKCGALRPWWPAGHLAVLDIIRSRYPGPPPRTGRENVTSNSLEPADDSTRDNALVLVVDDDAMLRAGLGNLFRSVGMEVALFASAAELLEFTIPDVPCCLVLDVRLRGPSGL